MTSTFNEKVKQNLKSKSSRENSNFTKHNNVVNDNAYLQTSSCRGNLTTGSSSKNFTDKNFANPGPINNRKGSETSVQNYLNPKNYNTNTFSPQKTSSNTKKQTPKIHTNEFEKNKSNKEL